MTAVALNADRLRIELARRGLHASDLARISRVSNATVCSAMKGRRVSSRTIRRIATALLAVEPLQGVEALLD